MNHKGRALLVISHILTFTAGMVLGIQFCLRLWDDVWLALFFTGLIGSAITCAYFSMRKEIKK